MSRYIDAENISNRINLTIKELSKDPIKYAFSIDNLETYLFMINEEKVEDVAPVIHAHWIETNYFDDYGDRFSYCSNCGKYELECSKYCRDCGARMDGETDD